MAFVENSTLPNSGDDGADGDIDLESATPAVRQQIKAFVARIERLEEDRANIMADQKEVYAEAKSMGFDTKILRKVVSLRKIDRRERQEADALTELYLGCVEG